MLIDWFTVAAQVINFLILLALLKYLLFDRIAQAMENREKRIEDRFDEAEQKEEAAEDKLDEYEKMKRQLEESREAKIEEAEQEAEKRREELLEEARRESESLRRKWRESLENEKDSFFRQFRQEAIRQIHRTAERALADLANAQLEKQAVKAFLDRFDELEEEALPEKTDNPPRVASGFELSEAQREKVRKTFSDRRPAYSEVRFEINPDLIFGLEVFVGGKKISWNGRQYLKDLQEKIEKAIQSEFHEPKSS